jgi:Lrp/AsnC family transcriptional regulator, regulator for asnA, asnC and gidA
MAHSIDETDRRIIALLQADGRRPNVDVAAEMGLAEGTIRKRLDRLLTSGVIRVTAVVDPARVGLYTSALITVQVDFSRVDEVVRHLADLPEVQSVCIATGNWDIILEAVFATDVQLLAFLKDRMASIPGVKRTETSHVLRCAKNVGQWELPLGNAEPLSSPVEPNMLRQTPLFSALRDSELPMIAQRCRLRHLEAGSRVYGQNEAATEIFLVDQGRLALLVDVGQGRQAMQGTVGRREICGIAAMLTPAVHCETARCLEQSTVLAIPATLLKELCLKDCRVCQQVMEKVTTVASTQLRDARFQLTHLLKAGEDTQPQGQTGLPA